MEQEVKGNKTDNVKDNVANSIEKKPLTKKRNSIVPILCFVIGILMGVSGTMLFFDIKPTETTKTDIASEGKANTKSTLEEMLEEEAFKIETAYIDLYYPAKWEEKVRVEYVEEETYTVQFFATLEDKEEVHIFDIIFGGEEGFVLGFVQKEEETELSVSVISYSTEFGDNWTDIEKNEINTMLEDINYIIGMLQKETVFEVAS